MNSSRRSEPRVRHFALVGVSILGIAGVLAGCQDDLHPPTHGVVNLILSGQSAGAFEGGQIFQDGILIDADVSSSTKAIVLPAGRHTFRFEKECAAVLPSPEITVDVAAGGETGVAWDVSVVGGVEVTSTIAGARILLDGVETGLVTPATLDCVEQGTHMVSLDLLGAAGGEARSFEVNEDLVRLEFDLAPLPQSRGAFLEVLTATECPNCLPVDEAAELLWEDEARVEAGGVTVQMHHPWAGQSDPYFTQETWDRNSFYGAGGGSAGHPIRYTNGLVRVQGAGSGVIEEIAAQMETEVDPFLEESALFAIYWLGVEHVAGDRIEAQARVFALDTVANPSLTEVLGMSYKDRLQTRVRIHGNALETFYRVVREIESAGTCAELGLEERGDFADIDFTFDLSWDTDWSEDAMGVIALVQETGVGGSKEIFNVRHVFVE